MTLLSSDVAAGAQQILNACNNGVMTGGKS